MKSAERLNKFQEKFHPDVIFSVGDGVLKAVDFLQINSVELLWFSGIVECNRQNIE